MGNDIKTLDTVRKSMPSTWQVTLLVQAWSPTPHATSKGYFLSVCTGEETLVEFCPQSSIPQAGSLHSFVERMSSIVDRVAASMKVDPAEVTKAADRKRWWDSRQSLDDELGSLLQELEAEVFGWRKCLLLSAFENKTLTRALRCGAGLLQEEFHSSLQLEVSRPLLAMVLQGMTVLSTEDLESFARHVLMSQSTPRDPDLCHTLVARIQDLFLRSVSEAASCDPSKTPSDSSLLSGITRQRKSIELLDWGVCLSVLKSNPRLQNMVVLDKYFQRFPLESMPCMESQPCSRIPSLLHLLWFWHQFESQFDEDGALSFDGTLRTFYLLNPSGDLRSTEEAFRDAFLGTPGWEGEIGRPQPIFFQPGSALHHLQESQLLIYCGHGSGERYFRREQVAEMLNPSNPQQCAPVALLIGCSSGRLHDRGSFDPTGAPLSYMLGGSPAVLGNMWDVTDKDIGSYFRAVMTRWMVVNPGERNNANELDEEVDEEEVVVIQRTAARKSRSRMATVGSSSRKSTVRKRPNTATSAARPTSSGLLASAVQAARSACKMRYLNGAAPLCFGVPVRLTTPVPGLTL